MPVLAGRAAAFRPAVLLSSPAARCLLPARVLAELLHLPVQVDPELAELDFGAWEGLDWNAVPRAQLDLWAADPLGFAPPGGESGRALLSRVGRVARRLRERGLGAMVMSHGGPLRLLPALLCDLVPDLLAPAPAIGSFSVVALP